MDQQTLRDWVHRYNAEGLEGLTDRHGGGTPCLLSPEQEVARWVSKGPDLARDGETRWRRANLTHAIEAGFGVIMAERSISEVLRRQAFARLVPWPRQSRHDPTAQASFSATSSPS
jgi:transposase